MASARAPPPSPTSNDGLPLLRTTVLQRVLLALLPALLISSIALSAVWGDNGLFARHQMRSELENANEELASLERENQRLLREISLADEDPLVLERLVAEELGWGREGSTIYRFEDRDQR